MLRIKKVKKYNEWSLYMYIQENDEENLRNSYIAASTSRLSHPNTLSQPH